MKIKTHKATAKRVKITKTGKALRVKAAKSHLLTHKSRRTKIYIELGSGDSKRVKKLTPYAN